MDSRVLSIAALFFLTAWSAPHRIANKDFRASIISRPIILDSSSPAVAAAEDIYLNFDTAKSVTNILAAQPLKIGQRFFWPTYASANPIAIHPAIISQQTKVDHLKEMIASIEEKPATDISVTDYAEILVKEELARRAKTPDFDKREITLSHGGQVLVSNQNESLTVASAKPARANLRAPLKPTPIIKETLSSAKTPSVEAPIIVAARTYEPAMGEFEITGPITFVKGAAFITGRHVIEIFQMVDGLKTSLGTINIPDASFRISAKNLEGQIIAEVRSREGQLFASGNIELDSLALKYSQKQRIKNIELTMAPAFGGVIAEVVSAPDFEKKKFAVPDARLQITGLEREIAYNKSKRTFVDDTITTPSNIIYKAMHERFWPTLAVGLAGDLSTIRLLPNKIIESLLSLTLNKHSAKVAVDLGIAWGRVLLGGQPIEGAQVRVVGETDKLPIYFNGLLPDKSRQRTSPNGEFAISMLEPGEKMVRVNLAEKMFWPVMLPIESKTVTYADLKIQPRRNIVFESVDAFSERPLVAEINPLGTDERHFVPDSGRIQMTADTIAGLTYIEARTDDRHVSVRVAVQPEQKSVRFNFVTKDWLERARAHLGLRKEPNQGDAVISILGDEYEIMLGAGSETRYKNIVYFDLTGRLVDQPVADGGAVILNIPQGLRSVTIVPQRNKKIVTRTIYFDNYAVALDQLNLTY